MNAKIKSNIVGLKELRENMETYIKRINKGESITVFRRSTPLFRISPVDSEEIGWETVVDFTKETGRGVPVEELLKSMKVYGQKSKVSKKTTGLDIKKLSGYSDVYRVRTGNIRIIFLDDKRHTEVLEISRRSEKTYKDF